MWIGSLMPRTSVRLTRMSPNPTSRPTPTGSARMIEPHAMANAGTMKVAVLAAVGVVRRRTRKKIGQATAVDRTPTATREIAPSRASVPGAPDEDGDGQRNEGAGGDHAGRELERLDIGQTRPGEVAGDRIAHRSTQAGGDREDRGGTRLEWRPADEHDHGHHTDGQAGRDARGDLLAHEPDGDGRGEQRRRGVEQSGEAGRQRDGRDRDQRERHGREQGPDDEEGGRATACDPERRRAGDSQQDSGADGEPDLGRPRRPDLGRGDAKEEERRAPDRPEEQERAEVDDGEWAAGRRRGVVHVVIVGLTAPRRPSTPVARHIVIRRPTQDETPPSDGVSVALRKLGSAAEGRCPGGRRLGVVVEGVAAGVDRRTERGDEVAAADRELGQRARQRDIDLWRGQRDLPSAFFQPSFTVKVTWSPSMAVTVPSKTVSKVGRFAGS